MHDSDATATDHGGVGDEEADKLEDCAAASGYMLDLPHVGTARVAIHVAETGDSEWVIRRPDDDPRKCSEFLDPHVAVIRDTIAAYRVLRNAWELALGEQLRDVQGGDGLDGSGACCVWQS